MPANRYVIQRNLRREGQAVTFIHTRAGSFDAVTSSVSGQTTINVSTKGVLAAFTDNEIDGTEIQRKDLKLTVPVLDFELAFPTFVPQAGDIVKLSDNTRYRIQSVRALQVNAAYMVQLRGGG